MKALALTPGSPAVYFIDDVDIGDITRFSALDFAKQITLIDLTLFKSIKSKEFLSLKWNGKEKLKHAPNIVAYTRFFNQQSFWVQKEILDRQCLIKRTEVLSFFIKLVKKLVSLNNLQSAMAILSALQVVCVYRLSHTWAGLTNRDRTTFSRLETLFSPDDNCHSQRQYMNSISLPGIPYVGIYLSDLTYINVAHPPVDGQPSPLATQKMNSVIDKVAHFQQSEYSFHVSECLNTYLCSQSYIEELQAFITEDNYTRSLVLEPGSTSTVNSNKKLESVNFNDSTASKPPSSSIDGPVANGAVNMEKRGTFESLSTLKQSSFISDRSDSLVTMEDSSDHSLSLEKRRCSPEITDITKQGMLVRRNAVMEPNWCDNGQPSCISDCESTPPSDYSRSSRPAVSTQVSYSERVFPDVPTLTFKYDQTDYVNSTTKHPTAGKFVLQLLYQGVVERRKHKLSDGVPSTDSRFREKDLSTTSFSTSCSNVSECGSATQLAVPRHSGRQNRLRKLLPSGSWQRLWANLVFSIMGDGQMSAFIVYYESNSKNAVEWSQFNEQKPKVQCLVCPSSTFTIPNATHGCCIALPAGDDKTAELYLLLATLSSFCADLNSSSNLSKHGFLAQIEPQCHREDTTEPDSFRLTDPRTGKTYLVRPIPPSAEEPTVVIIQQSFTHIQQHRISRKSQRSCHSKTTDNVPATSIVKLNSNDSTSSSVASANSSTGQSTLVNQWIESITSILNKVKL